MSTVYLDRVSSERSSWVVHVGVVGEGANNYLSAGSWNEYPGNKHGALRQVAAALEAAATQIEAGVSVDRRGDSWVVAAPDGGRRSFRERDEAMQHAADLAGVKL